jgi:enoyl-CoA hydratase/carnithine racemase
VTGTRGGVDLVVDPATAVASVRLDRPEKRNALDLDLLRDFAAVIAAIDHDDDVRVVHLSGAGASFCAGADLGYVESIREDPMRVREFLLALKAAVVALEQVRQPVVAEVHGLVLAGGLELMLGADLVVAAASTRFGDQHVNWGFIPGGGSTQRLPRRIGLAKACDLLLTGRWVTAGEALDMGLVSRVVEDDDLATEAADLAARIAGKSAEATAQIKRLARLATEIPLDAGLDEEINVVVAHYKHPDFARGLAEFRARGDRRSG